MRMSAHRSWWAAVWLSSLAVVATGETLFFADFEDGIDAWPDFPTLSAEQDGGNGVLAFDTLADDQNVDALFLDNFADLTDYTARARFNIVEETAEFAAFGLIVRAATPTTYMLVEPARKRLCCGDPRENVLNVFERGGAWPIVATADVDLPMNAWHEIAVTVTGAALTVFVNGDEVAQYDAVPYPSGAFGVRIWKSKVLVDDFEVFDAGGSSLAVSPGDRATTAWAALKRHKR